MAASIAGVIIPTNAPVLVLIVQLPMASDTSDTVAVLSLRSLMLSLIELSAALMSSSFASVSAFSPMTERALISGVNPPLAK